MRLSFRQYFILVCVLVVVCLPKKVLAGLQANIQNDLALEPTSLSYDKGYLYANLEGKQLQVKVAPKIVIEAIEIVEKTDIEQFQVSIDDTFSGANKYKEKVLKNTIIGEIFLDADIEFNAVITGRIPLPKGAPDHPIEKAKSLLKDNSEYRNLTTKWLFPPESWSQIYMYFDHTKPSLIHTEFKPQLLFKSNEQFGVKVDKITQTIAERPYLPLQEDVRKRPHEYIKLSPNLESAASITATLGLINSACNKPKSCKHLYQQTNKFIKNSSSYSNKNSGQQNLNYEDNSFFQSWITLFLEKFKSSDRYGNWSTAYDAVWTVLILQDMNVVDEEHLEHTKNYAIQNFQNYKIPSNESLLQAALSVTQAWEGKIDSAKKNLKKAVQLSKDDHGNRIIVTDLGIEVAKIIQNSGNKYAGNIIFNNMKALQSEAKIKTFDEIDHYLSKCEQSLDKCSLKELQQYESWSLKAKLKLLKSSENYTLLSKRDISWLHGRFSYLIGIKLNSKVQQKDRLRFLSFYAQKTHSTENKTHLNKLLMDFQERLGIASSTSAIPPIILHILLPFGIIGTLYLLVKNINKNKNRISNKVIFLKRCFKR